MLDTYHLTKYLDTKAAARAALIDLPYMQGIVKRGEERYAELKERMFTLGMAGEDARVKATPDIHAQETRITSVVDDKWILEEQLEGAYTYLAWFEPVWESLSIDDRHVLETFYLKGNTSWGAQSELSELYGCTRKTTLQKGCVPKSGISKHFRCLKEVRLFPKI